MPKITIDNRAVDARDGATVLEAAEKLGIHIPTLCYFKGCEAQSSCLVCVVRVDGRPGLVPACATKVTEGMVVESETDDIKTARRTALELLLGDHLGDCVAPCQSVCPAHMDIAEMIRCLSGGRLREAIEVVKEHIPLPATLGRICPNLCEKGCKRAEKDSAISICLLKRYVADADLASDTPYIPETPPKTGRHVAIVGAGPCGLSTAYYLRRDGIECTIIDLHEKPGGKLVYGDWVDRLDPAVVAAEARIIESMGARFRLGEKIDSAKSLQSLENEFDAVLLATGSMDKTACELLGVAATSDGIEVRKSFHATSLPGVFAAGSAVKPSHHVVRTVADGRAAAIEIAGFLGVESRSKPFQPFSVHLGHVTDDEMNVMMQNVNPGQRCEPAVTSEGLSASQAEYEAQRCLKCDCSKLQSCRLRAAAIEYGASVSRFKGERRPVERETTSSEVVYEPGKCISCGLCIQIAEDVREELGLAYTGRGFTVRIAVPFDESVADGLKSAAQKCAEACPTAAISLKRN